MAKCRICGKWAGLFTKEHALCAAIEIRNENSGAILPPAEDKPVTNIHIDPKRAVVTVVFGSDAAAQTPTDRGRLTSHLITVLFAKAKLNDKDLKIALVVKLSSCVANGETYRDFEAWCANAERPLELRTLDASWFELMFWCAWSVIHAQNRAANWQPGMEAVFPYRQVFADACRLPQHKALDRFTAKSTDQIWAFLHEPMGWLCGCTIHPILESDEGVTPEADIEGESRLDPKLVKSCWNWMAQSPREALKILGG